MESNGHDQEIVFQLLGERLVVDREKRQIGEVIIRKVVETEMVSVPLRREKLIIERVDDPVEKIGEVELSREKAQHIQGITAEFPSLQIAIEALKILSLQNPGESNRVHLEIFVQDGDLRTSYQNLLDNWSSKYS
ncbi:MAG: hypothetical protein N5P05_001768 [Chroococcopsis gigantea SAG 12.99]|jgi:hypothetical protein|nr:hypothetical protein [Chroococcopsis gigantea SAG 12.99]